MYSLGNYQSIQTPKEFHFHLEYTTKLKMFRNLRSRLYYKQLSIRSCIIQRMPKCIRSIIATAIIHIFLNGFIQKCCQHLISKIVPSYIQFRFQLNFCKFNGSSMHVNYDRQFAKPTRSSFTEKVAYYKPKTYHQHYWNINKSATHHKSFQQQRSPSHTLSIYNLNNSWPNANLRHRRNQILGASQYGNAFTALTRINLFNSQRCTFPMLHTSYRFIKSDSYSQNTSFMQQEINNTLSAIANDNEISEFSEQITQNSTLWKQIKFFTISLLQSLFNNIFDYCVQYCYIIQTIWNWIAQQLVPKFVSDFYNLCKIECYHTVQYIIQTRTTDIHKEIVAKKSPMIHVNVLCPRYLDQHYQVLKMVNNRIRVLENITNYDGFF